ncbi:L-threonylcarbamoyladenylate synthase [Actinomadura scrupuli]|uniref:L-threonylcarbamoyladenylate synthase n=1 Tax=Actinomadura scrupuli TaxID=559629 RepID=UPI003D9779C0
MVEPEHVFRASELTRGGSLSARALKMIAGKLMQRGFVMLPSDTCYSVAALPLNEHVRNKINKMLGRPDMEISLAFPSAHSARKHVRLGLAGEMLLQSFCPGPITIVCPTNPKRIPAGFARNIAAPDQTIGVRIPDSIIERDVAGSTEYPVTTVAVRDGEGDGVRSFEQALEIVSRGMKRIDGPGWFAIEGADFYERHSTVVRVAGPSDVRLLREGHIPFTVIQAAVRQLPAVDPEEWS